MSGASATMASPSISSTRRSTPWVDGCCGPMLSTIVWSPVPALPCSRAFSTTSSIPGVIMSGAAMGAIERCLPLPVAFDGIVLAQRMAFPVLGHHDARQARVAGKVDAEEVEDLALVKVRRGPDRSDGIECEIGGTELNGEAHAVLQAVRKNVVGKLEAWLLRIPVDCRHILEKVVSGGLHGLARGDDVFLCYRDRQFVSVELRVGRQIGERLDRGVIRHRLEDGGLAQQGRHWGRHYRSPLSSDQVRMPFFQT